MGKINYQPPIQIKGLREIQRLGYITDFDFKRDYKGDYKFYFYLTNQLIGEETVSVDFSAYKIRIEYHKTIPPKVFIEEPILSKRKHIYEEGNLCLYHKSEFKWGDDKSISFDLIPWIYMWIYFNDIWIKTGKWIGEEYQH